MKCKHCGGEQFVARQVCRMEILVDGDGNYIDGVHKDIGLDIYDSETAYGPFQCTGCGAEYNALKDGQDSIDGPIEGWTWEEDEPDEGMEMKSWTYLVMCLQKHKDQNRHGYWTDGEEILCKTEAAAEHLANFLEDIGFDAVHTGYYDPEEDQRNNEVNDHTGWYYVCFD